MEGSSLVTKLDKYRNRIIGSLNFLIVYIYFYTTLKIRTVKDIVTLNEFYI